MGIIYRNRRGSTGFPMGVSRYPGRPGFRFSKRGVSGEVELEVGFQTAPFNGGELVVSGRQDVLF